MSNIKNSFVLYNDYIDTTDELSDEEAGKLFKMILAKVNGREIECDSKLLRLIFKPIEKSIDRDLQKYENKIQEKSNAGQIGNLKRWNKDLYDDFQKGKIDLEEALKIAKHRKTSQSDKSVAKVADSVSDSDTGSENENDIENEGVGENDIEMDLNTVAKKFLKNNKVVEVYLQDHKLKDKNELISKMKEFHVQLAKDDKTSKTLTDYRKHLDYWLKKKSGSAEKEYEKKVGGYSAADVDRMYGKYPRF